MSKRYLTLKKRPLASQSAFHSGSPVHRNPKKEKAEVELAEKLNSWQLLGNK